jgi:hypothetical protein
MQQLWKKRYGNRGGGDKFYIDCSRYTENPDSFEIKSLLRYTSDTYVKILETLAKDTIIHDKYRHIVVKIGPSDDIPKKEYEIGEKLKNANGFITHICLVRFYDDMKWKYVLVMPYIRDGSIEKYNWTTENIHILKNTMIHIILSMAVAFKTTGFIHRDFHLGNVLLNKTKVEEMEYILDKEKNIIIKEPTMGYKIVIMDFEKAELNTTDIYYFWDDLNTVFKDIDGKENNNNSNNQKVYWKEERNILSFIKEKRDKREPLRNILELIDDIKKSSIIMKDKNPPLSYNPNDIFGF